ncbi:MAG: hypothetical protein R3C19_15490 [Planctomycetaceae bacterium]
MWRVRRGTLSIFVCCLVVGGVRGDVIEVGDVSRPFTGVGFDRWVGNAGVGSMEINGGTFEVNNVGRVGRQAGSDGTVLVTGAGSTWQNDRQLNIGESGTGRLTVQNAGTVTYRDTGIIGQNAGSTGRVTVTGTGSRMRNLGGVGGGIRVGEAGSGTLNVLNGGVAEDASPNVADGWIGRLSGSTGTVNVDGAGSFFEVNSNLHIGQDGTGELNITNGGRARNNAANVGATFNGTGSGTVTVDGAGSTWSNFSGINVGDGSITISNGASVTSTFGIVGNRSGATGSVLVTGTGSSWAAGGGNAAFQIGQSGGTGSLTIENGGLVTSGLGNIAAGTVIVRGTGSTWQNTGSNGLTIGSSLGASQTGKLNIENGGLVVNVTGLGRTRVGPQGILNVAGGTLQTATVEILNGGQVNLSGGKIEASGTVTPGAPSNFSMTGGELEAPTIQGDFAFSGGTLDVETVNGTLTQSGGLLAPGDSPGITTINGNYLLSGGSIGIEIAGLTQGTGFDFIDINGNWILTGGSLDVSFLGGFTAANGSTFDLFDFDSVSGTFDTLNLPSLSGGLAWDSSNLYSSGSLSVTAVPEPSTWGICGLLLGGALVRSCSSRRRHRRLDGTKVLDSNEQRLLGEH